LYKSVQPLIKEGEKIVYHAGRELDLVFCNNPSRFGAGIGYLLAQGDQAIFSLYLCEQTEEMSKKYITGDGFSGSGSGRPDEYNTTGASNTQIVYPCGKCGGFIMSGKGDACGNAACNGKGDKNQKRYLLLQKKMEEQVHDGTHVVYACNPCQLCRFFRTRPLACTVCVKLSE
jgi:hypothetical protein